MSTFIMAKKEKFIHFFCIANVEDFYFCIKLQIIENKVVTFNFLLHTISYEVNNDETKIRYKRA